MSKKSKIWKIDSVRIQSVLDNANSVVDALKALGFNPHSGNHRTLLRRIKEDKLSLEQLKKKSKKIQKTAKKTKSKNIFR